MLSRTRAPHQPPAPTGWTLHETTERLSLGKRGGNNPSVKRLIRPSRSYIHRPTIAKSYPATNDAIHKPEAHQRDREPHKEKPDSQGRDGEGSAEGDPEQSKPEGSDLPAKMRVKPGTASFAPLDVVEDDRDDRWPAGEKCPDHGSRANDTGQQAECV